MRAGVMSNADRHALLTNRVHISPWAQVNNSNAWPSMLPPVRRMCANTV